MDSRFAALSYFSDLLTPKLGNTPFNIKVEIPRIAPPPHDFYNVYIYLEDAFKIFKEEEWALYNISGLSKESLTPYRKLFYKALLKYPIPELENRKLNVLCFEDFGESARAYSLRNAGKDFDELLKTVKGLSNFIVGGAGQTSQIWLFFDNDVVMANFCSPKFVKSFKEKMLEVLKVVDIHHAWRMEKIHFCCDLQSTYDKIGGFYYWRSELDWVKVI